MRNIKRVHVIEIGYKAVHKDIINYIKNKKNLIIKEIVNVKLKIKNIQVPKKQHIQKYRNLK